jgi:N6-adenosine-specific RNA methylase IME4/ParB-like chromosome segregation protein Spo0J
MPLLPIDSIKVEHRFRQHMGDMKPLMESIGTLGLLHAIVVNQHRQLIAGARRLAACKKLGWTQIPCRVVNLDDLELRAEYDENIIREPFLPSEAVAIKRALEPLERARAQQRMLEGANQGGRGKRKKPCENLSQGLPSKTRERVALYTGLSFASLRKAEEIVEAAEREPEKYADLAADLDRKYRSLSWLHRKLKVRQESERLKAEPPSLPSGKFSVICCDPPWSYESENGNGNGEHLLPYASMSIEDITALPIPKLAQENCLLFLWATNTHLHSAFHILEAWDFRYRTTLTWVKNARSMGSLLRSITEHCLLATKGRPFVSLSTQTTVVYGGVGRVHSKKPEEFYQLVESLCPQPDKLELFARTKRSGWESYGLMDDSQISLSHE